MNHIWFIQNLSETRNTLTQYIEAIKKMNSQVQSKDKEIEIMQGTKYSTSHKLYTIGRFRI